MKIFFLLFVMLDQMQYQLQGECEWKYQAVGKFQIFTKITQEYDIFSIQNKLLGNTTRKNLIWCRK